MMNGLVGIGHAPGAPRAAPRGTGLAWASQQSKHDGESLKTIQRRAGRMAQLNLSLEHGQPMEVAQAQFQAAVLEAQSQFSRWIRRVDWSEDRSSVTFAGGNFEVKLWYDDRDLHAQGTIPLAWKLFEGAIRNHIKKAIERHA